MLVYDAPSHPNVSGVTFQRMYDIVYGLCLHQKHPEVSALLDSAIAHAHSVPHTDWHLHRLSDICMYYDNTCAHTGLARVWDKVEAFRSKIDRFETPPSTP